MLRVQRRHYGSCKRKQLDPQTDCKCPIWIVGTLKGVPRIQKPVSKFLPPPHDEKLEMANSLARYWEMVGGPLPWPAPMPLSGTYTLPLKVNQTTVERAVTDFLAECTARGLSGSTYKKNRVLTDELRAFAARNGYQHIVSFGDIEVCRAFRGSWNDANISAQKKLERFRSFVQFCVDSKWLDENPAKKTKAPNTSDVYTPPFTDDEVARIIAAIPLLPVHMGNTWRRYASDTARPEDGVLTHQRMEAMVLFMLYSGLRISDTCLSGPGRLDFETGVLVIRHQKKTGQPVTTFLPPFVVEKLKDLPLLGRKYWFFYTGKGKIATATGNARRTFRKLFKLANVQDGHPHRFRDTFAVRLLNSGAKLEEVSLLLGHGSIKATEQHYAPFVKSRADHLLKVVQRAWALESAETHVGKAAKKRLA